MGQSQPYSYLRAYSDLSPAELLQIRKVPDSKLERRYFIYKGIVFDAKDFTERRGSWLSDGSCMTICYIEKEMVLVQVERKVA